MPRAVLGPATAPMPALVEPLMSRGNTALLSLCHASTAFDEPLVEAARREVTSRRREHAARGVEWGFLLGLERAATEASFPAAWRLCDALHREVVRPVGMRERADFRFSFCKAYSGAVIREAEGVHYEGLHIDTHPELGDGTDLLRVLINVGKTERRFRFGDVTRAELAERGLYTDRESFRADHVEPHVPLREVRIPGCTNSGLSFLVFWASVLPHVGVTEAPGYFLFSFEAVVKSRWTGDASPQEKFGRFPA